MVKMQYMNLLKLCENPEVFEEVVNKSADGQSIYILVLKKYLPGLVMFRIRLTSFLKQ